MNNSFNNQKFEINMFRNIWDIENENQEKNCNVEIPLEAIQTGTHGIAEQINAIRNAASKEEAKTESVCRHVARRLYSQE